MPCTSQLKVPSHPSARAGLTLSLARSSPKRRFTGLLNCRFGTSRSSILFDGEQQYALSLRHCLTIDSIAGKCSVYPGGDFETFDKEEITFKTNCSYQAVGRDEPNGKYNFRVSIIIASRTHSRADDKFYQASISRVLYRHVTFMLTPHRSG